MDRKLKPYLDLHEYSAEAIDTRILCFLKVGRKLHLESLAEGELFCHHLAHYCEAKHSDKAFFDEHEGLSGIFQADQVQFQVGVPPVRLDLEPGTQAIVANRLKVPAFCLYAMHTGDWTHRQFPEEDLPLFKDYLEISKNMHDFRHEDEEPYVWLANDGNAFVERVRKACEREKLGLRGDLVRYVDLKKYHGKVREDRIGFVKQGRFSYQREYRFLFQGDDLENPFRLDIGKMKKTEFQIMPLAEFRNKVELRFD